MENICLGCGEDDDRVLIPHHTDWYFEKGHPKSNKNGGTIMICCNCHHLIHHYVPMFFSLNMAKQMLQEIKNGNIVFKSKEQKSWYTDSLRANIEAVKYLNEAKNETDQNIRLIKFLKSQKKK